LQNTGTDAIRDCAGKWLSAYQSSIGYEVRNPCITTGETAAFCHHLYRHSETLNEGGKVDMWVRATICLQKTDGKWLIVHGRQSVAFERI
jgi:ketosteroid isomerase-like protein